MKNLKMQDLKRLEEMFANLKNDVTMVYFTEKVRCRHCRQERKLLQELVDLSHKLHLEVYNYYADRDVVEDYGVNKVPGLILRGQKDYGIRYYGMPSDFEFRMLLEDIVRVSSGVSGLSPETAGRVHKLRDALHLEVFTTPACPFSRDPMRWTHQMAMESDKITADLVHLDDFPEVIKKYNITAAPSVVVNGHDLFYGALPEPEFVERILKGVQKSGDSS